MIRLRSLSVLALVATTTFVAFGPQVRADGMPDGTAPPAPAPTALSRLTDEQRAFVLHRIPDFDARPPAEREKIAANVLRLWAMSPEDRAKVVERASRAEANGPGVRGVFDFALKVRAISTAIVATLSPAARELLTVGASPTSIAYFERVQLDQAVATAWHRKVVGDLVATPPADADPATDSKPDSKSALEFVASRDAVKAAGGAAAPEADRKRFAKAFFDDRVSSARRAVERAAAEQGTPPGGARSADARVEVLGRALADAFPTAAQSVAVTLAAAVEKGRPGLEKFVHDATDRGTARERAIFDLIRMLERSRLFVSGELLVKLVDLQASLLRELKVSEADVATFQSSTDEKTRLLILAPLARRYGSQDRDRGPHSSMTSPRDRDRRFPRWGGMNDDPPPKSDK